ERRRERRAVLAVAPRARAVPAALAERDEAAEHLVEEEAEPDALAAALPPDAVHAVVPVPRTHVREPVRTHPERAVEGAAAVRVEVGHLLRGRRQEVGLVLARGEQARRRSEERRVGKEGRSRWSPKH